MDKIKLLLTIIIAISIIVGGLYWIAKSSINANINRVEHINKGFGYGKAMITDMKAYKGHSVHVRYRIGNKEYVSSVGWDKNPKDLHEGDSIDFRYALDNPELIITEMNNEY